MKHISLKVLLSGLWIAIVVALPFHYTVAQVDGVSDDVCSSFGIECGDGDAQNAILDYIWVGVQAFLIFTGTIAFAALVYYGAVFILSRGSEEDARRAKVGITYALIGIFVIGLAGFIVNAIINIGAPTP